MWYVRVRAERLSRLLSALLLLAQPAMAAEESPRTYTIQGRFTDASGSAPLLDTISLTLGIYNPAGTCLLYEETQTGIDLTTTGGVFSVQLGSISSDVTKRTANDPARTMAQVFANAGAQIVANGPNCPGGYTPASGDGRKLRITYTPSAGAPVTLSPDQSLNAAPQASVAETLQGVGPAGFIQTNGASNLSQATAQQLTNGTDIAGLGTPLHNHDTAYARLSSNSAQNMGGGGLFSSGAIGTGVAVAPVGMQLQVKASADNVIGAVIQPSSATQSADLLQIRNNAGAPVFQVSPAGTLTVSNATAATVGANQSSSSIMVSGQFWTGATSATDTWTIQDVLAAGTNPVSSLKLTHSGSSGAPRVVIETADPELKMVRTAGSYATVNFDDQSKIGFDGTTGRMAISTNYTGNDILFMLGTGNDKYVSFSGTGSVGIGTGTPLAPLNFVPPSGTTTTTSDINTQGSAGTGNITVGSTAGFPTTGVMLIDNEAITYSVINGTSLDIVARATLGTSGATHGNGATVRFIEELTSKGSGTTPHEVISSTGDVGIGVAAPRGILDVMAPSTSGEAIIGRITGQTAVPLGTLNVHVKSTGSASDGFGPEVAFSMQDTSGLWGDLGRIGAVRAGADNTGDLVFRPVTAGTANERMRVTSAGNVGIGTNNPAVPLEVQRSFATPVAADQYTALFVPSYTVADTGTKMGVGVSALATHTAGTIPLVIGTASGPVAMGNGGTVTTGIGFSAGAKADTGAILGTYAGFHVQNATGVGTVINQIGLLVNSLTKGTTNNIAILVEGNNKSLFGGAIGIGADPTQALEVNGGIRLNTVTAKPACDSTTRGTTWFTQGGAGVKDSYEVCAKDAADAYAWRTLY
jgi:hypothetical protein